MSETRKSIITILSIVLTIVVADICIGIVGRFSLKHLPDTYTEIARMKHSVAITKAECVILGSSNASRDYNSNILEDSLGVTVYNAGRDGREISYSLAVLKALLRRYTPKLIVLDLQYDECKEFENRVNVLKPFFNDYPELLDVNVMVNGDMERVKSHFNSYIFNAYFSDVIASYFSSDYDTAKGYNPIYGKTISVNQKALVCEDSILTTSEVHQKCLFEINELCKARGVNLMVVISPEFVKNKVVSPLYSELKNLHIALYDYHNDDYFMNKPELFYDNWHLNENGSNIFSSRIAKDIRKELHRGF